MKKRVSPLQNPHANLAAKPPTFSALFVELWKGGTRFLMVVLDFFARRPLTLSYDNNARAARGARAAALPQVECATARAARAARP